MDVTVSKPAVAPSAMNTRVKEAFPTEYRQRGGTYKVQ